MSRSKSRRRRRGGGAGHEDGGERWLLTYADMITLLMALFMVLFSISSVNVSKVRELQKSLRAAFAGNILPGGKSIAQPGATANSSHTPSTADVQAIVPLSANSSSNLEKAATGQASTSQSTSSIVPGSPNVSPSATASQSASASSPSSATVTQTSSSKALAAAALHEQNEFKQIKRQLEAYAVKHGFSEKVHIAVEQRGLVIRVLTDSLLFPSGSATLDAQADPLLTEIAGLVNIDHVHPIAVEGNTDNVPIHSSMFPSNWELSTARASTVVRYLVSKNVEPQRLSATGYADMRPIASNATPQGRALNRRVEIVLQRLY
jgi:chemotaxis protein MotB